MPGVQTHHKNHIRADDGRLCCQLLARLAIFSIPYFRVCVIVSPGACLNTLQRCACDVCVAGENEKLSIP